MPDPVLANAISQSFFDFAEYNSQARCGGTPTPDIAATTNLQLYCSP
jgi:hypothetical protein